MADAFMPIEEAAFRKEGWEKRTKKAEKKIYTKEDYFAIPEDVRAELINGRIYYMASPSRIHQEVLLVRVHVLVPTPW